MPGKAMEPLEWHWSRSCTYAPVDGGCYWVPRREDGLFWFFNHIDKNHLDTPDVPCATMAEGKLRCHEHNEKRLATEVTPTEPVEGSEKGTT